MASDHFKKQLPTSPLWTRENEFMPQFTLSTSSKYFYHQTTVLKLNVILKIFLKYPEVCQEIRWQLFQ